jgi:putative PIN family toxin of toxin-antitoxin system
MNARFVFDTNALVSAALLSGSVARRAFDAARSSGVILASQATVTELTEVLWRPKFDRYVSIEQRQALLREASSIAVWVELTPTLAARQLCRDPDDDKFIHTALAGEADVLVSGDRDLLDLGRVGELLILSPADAFAWMAQR